ncbi:PaREP1 family protein [Pyrobaculum aerophilum]|uniref:PaREP1 n=2 Tax=Pyrobaculum aerophilum TaxID=13773 RepID=Q8ZY27_PYRAE|nr:MULTISPECIES: PaREP1 family protein [Pyrobaculum]AAL63169.1 paREP1 [Pyrobaculum aerophilum str. IM2]MCX8136138.1 PaREP1 family protein [Pyrobaculum aerophilum]HII48071.1 hypothetical protein [Pyrobaculum aerophilum]
MEVLPKPWFDLRRYKEVRLREAVYEAEISEEFLEEGLVRNAAGKAFQSWKAVVAAHSVDKLEELKKAFPGRKRLRGSRRVVEKAMWVIAIMPTSALKKVAQIIGGEVDLYTNLALLLHEYQYNGPDPEGILSIYPDDDSAAKDVRKLIEKARQLATALK